MVYAVFEDERREGCYKWMLSMEILSTLPEVKPKEDMHALTRHTCHWHAMPCHAQHHIVYDKTAQAHCSWRGLSGRCNSKAFEHSPLGPDVLCRTPAKAHHVWHAQAQHANNTTQQPHCDKPACVTTQFSAINSNCIHGLQQFVTRLVLATGSTSRGNVALFGAECSPICWHAESPACQCNQPAGMFRNQHSTSELIATKKLAHIQLARLTYSSDADPVIHCCCQCHLEAPYGSIAACK